MNNGLNDTTDPITAFTSFAKKSVGLTLPPAPSFNGKFQKITLKGDSTAGYCFDPFTGIGYAIKCGKTINFKPSIPATPAKTTVIEVQPDIETIAPPVATGIEQQPLSEEEKALKADLSSSITVLDSITGTGTATDTPADDNAMPSNYDANIPYDDSIPLSTDELIAAGASVDNSTSSQPATMPNKTANNSKFSLSQFSLMGQSSAMIDQMTKDVFVLDGIAILGQSTAIYAQFNTGKTLLTIWLLVDSIKAGRIKGDDVYYLNADDTYNGLVTKNIIAERYGFHMIAPNLNGFDPDAMQGYMRHMIDDDTARGKVIILDTLKKFTDLMNKKTGSQFMKRAREFVLAGGTLIMLAHTNKNKDASGKVVYGGTNDVPSDCDCVFTLDTVSDDGITKQVLFEKIKSRGNVANEKAFSYSCKADDYHGLMESVTTEDDATAKQAKEYRAINAKREKDKPAINAITETIEQGITLKTELVDTASKSAGISKPKIISALDNYKGELWGESIGAKNAKSYHLIHVFEANEYSYGFSKNGS